MNDNRFGRRHLWEDADRGPSAVRCKIDAFAQFSLWLDGELAKLERLWTHRVPPRRRPTDARCPWPKPR
ncbi:MAG: hypothetical protein NTW96_10770 [Planctomycetia bacterium]|nr:hypothetical protein [Planctomycetia bacterium]